MYHCCELAGILYIATGRYDMATVVQKGKLPAVAQPQQTQSPGTPALGLPALCSRCRATSLVGGKAGWARGSQPASKSAAPGHNLLQNQLQWQPRLTLGARAKIAPQVAPRLCSNHTGGRRVRCRARWQPPVIACTQVKLHTPALLRPVAGPSKRMHTGQSSYPCAAAPGGSPQ
jgi:hypothetical protein